MIAFAILATVLSGAVCVFALWGMNQCNGQVGGEVGWGLDVMLGTFLAVVAMVSGFVAICGTVALVFGRAM